MDLRRRYVDCRSLPAVGTSCLVGTNTMRVIKHTVRGASCHVNMNTVMSFMKSISLGGDDRLKAHKFGIMSMIWLVIRVPILWDRDGG